jgi:predicted RecB family nuclease
VRVGAAINWRPAKAAIFCHRAAALLSGKAALFREPDLPPGPHLYLDIESDLQQSYCWLVGVGSDSDDHIEQFLAPTPQEERAMLSRFINYVAVRAEPSLLHFSGSNFDRRLLLKRLTHYGIEVPRVLETSIDSHKELFYSLCVPASSFGLKEVAGALGYQFAYPELDGFAVAYRYQKAVAEVQPVPAELLHYNRDDVLALRHVIRCTRALGPAA